MDLINLIMALAKIMGNKPEGPRADEPNGLLGGGNAQLWSNDHGPDSMYHGNLFPPTLDESNMDFYGWGKPWPKNILPPSKYIEMLDMMRKTGLRTGK